MWWLGYQHGLGAMGGWIGLAFEVFLSAAILGHRLFAGNWRVAAIESRARLEDVAREKDVAQAAPSEAARAI
jgi:hypothetical protein